MDAALIQEILLLIVTVTWQWCVAIYKALVPVKFQYQKDVSKDTVLITGAGSGIGRLMSQRFAKLGCQMVLWDINESGNQETASLLKGVKVSTYTVDLSDREAIYKTAEKVKADGYKVDILVNNAGIVTGRAFLECPDALIQKTMDVNTSAHFWTCKAFLPGMMERNHGHVVSIASSAGLFGVAALADYCSSKFGAVGFNECIRGEMNKLGKNGVHTTVVCPYFINTGMFEGCKSRFPAILPLLNPSTVADKIVEAVRTNQHMLITPKVLYHIYMLRGILPIAVADKMEKFFGVGESMNEFVGRGKAKAS